MQARWFHIIEEKRRKKKSSPVAAAGGAVGTDGVASNGAGAQHQQQQPQEKKKRMRRVDVKLLAEAATKSARGDDLFEHDAQHPHQHGGAGNGTARRGPVAALDDLADLASPAAVGVAGPGSARPRKRSKVSAAQDADGDEDGDDGEGGAASPPVRVTRSNAGNGKSPARGAAAKPSAADSWKATYVHNLKKKMQAAPNGKGKGEAGKAKGATARALEVATAGPKGRVNGLATAVQVGGVVAGLVGGKVKVAATGRGAASSSHSPGTRKRLGLLHVDVEDGDDEDEDGAEEEDGYADDMADDEEGDYN